MTADTTYVPKTYERSGGDVSVIASGGALVVESGGYADFESGGQLRLAGTAITSTAAELNTIDLSVVGALVKVKKISVAAGDWTTETDSTWDLPAKAMVIDVFIDVTTQQSGKTVNIGLLSSESGGDADGFMAAGSLAATGLIRGTAALDGGSAYWASNTRGALLSKYAAGTNADDRGLYVPVPHASTAVTSKSVSYTTSSGTTTAVFDIYIVYIELG